MTIFLRLLAPSDKASALLSLISHIRQGKEDGRCYRVEPESFTALPTAPFTYWASERQLALGRLFGSFEPLHGAVRVGVQTDDDARFVRLFWEPFAGAVGAIALSCKWVPFLKGEGSAPFFFDHLLVLNWASHGRELKVATAQAPGGRVNNESDFGKPGFSWAVRTLAFQPHVVQVGCIPSVSRYLAMSNSHSPMAILALLNSAVVDAQCKLRMEKFEGPKFIPGVVKQIPIPDLERQCETTLGVLGQEAYTLMRALRSTDEVSHAFLLPALLRSRVGDCDLAAIDSRLEHIQNEIDEITFDLYGFDDVNRAAIRQASGMTAGAGAVAASDEEDGAGVDQDDSDESSASTDAQVELLSWCVGVAFGRFDWRLATGECSVPPEPGPFDPLRTRSPGMLPDGAQSFCAQAGILVDDKGDPRDLPHLVEEVLLKVKMPVPDNVSDWVRRDFFLFHLRRYSKSKRKAPIYWPLSTRSGGYTLWVYYPSLTDQTLYTAVNDFVEPKLRLIAVRLATLGAKGSKRMHDEEKRLEELEDMEEELTELRDTLLKIAPTYHPDQDDGVQITAAPLWPLFRHKPWQKLLKETWAKLEKGDYDWAQIAMHYWPDRVCAKCTTDKSLAIAHGLDKPL